MFNISCCSLDAVLRKKGSEWEIIVKIITLILLFRVENDLLIEMSF